MTLKKNYFVGLKYLQTSIFIVVISYYSMSAIFITIIISLTGRKNMFLSYIRSTYFYDFR